jgi:hypothetical protein
LIDRISASPREIGNAVLYLLQHKRSLSEPDIISGIDAKIKIRKQVPEKAEEYEKELHNVLVKLQGLENESKEIIQRDISRLARIKKIVPPPTIPS